MSIAKKLLAEFEPQALITRRFLERLPEDRFMWKPHAKSLTAGQLALHLATVPGGVIRGAQRNQIPPSDFTFPQPESLEQVLDAFHQSIATVREVLPTLDDTLMNEIWRIVDGDHELLAIPRETLLRDIMLNHWYQHRGQFSVYLRMLNISVPASWGPSADEPAPFRPELQEV